MKRPYEGTLVVAHVLDSMLLAQARTSAKELTDTAERELQRMLKDRMLEMVRAADKLNLRVAFSDLIVENSDEPHVKATRIGMRLRTEVLPK